MNLEELRTAYEAATPGTRSVDEGNFATTMECQAEQLVAGVGTDREWTSVCAGDEEDLFAWVIALAHPTNANFIALAHNAFPVLLKAVELCELMSRMKTDEELEGGMSGDDAISTLGGLIESARDIVEELE